MFGVFELFPFDVTVNVDDAAGRETVAIFIAPPTVEPEQDELL